MEIRKEKENENKVQVILQEAELKDQQITINDFMQNSSVVENLVYDIALRYLGWTDEQIGKTNVTFSILSNNNIMLEFVSSNNINFDKIKNHVDKMSSLCGESNEEKTTEGVILTISSLSDTTYTKAFLECGTFISVLIFLIPRTASLMISTSFSSFVYALSSEYSGHEEIMIDSSSD